MNRKEYVNEKETNTGSYTNQEIDRIVAQESERILKYCRELEIEYASIGVYNTNDTIRVLLDLNDKELYIKVSRQGISSELLEGLNKGDIVQVYTFETGRLEDMALEGLDYSMEDGEAEKVYKKYKNDEISEEDYFAKYHEIIKPWMDCYFEDHVNTVVEINTVYPDGY